MIHKLIKWQRASYMGITVVDFSSFLLPGLLSSHQNSEDVFAELIGSRLDGASESVFTIKYNSIHDLSPPIQT